MLGFFALRFINPNLVRSWLESANSSGNMIAAGIGVGILTIPLIASVSEDALSAVPNALREASAGVGARKITTTLSIVLPAAISGLVAALIIGDLPCDRRNDGRLHRRRCCRLRTLRRQSHKTGSDHDRGDGVGARREPTRWPDPVSPSRASSSSGAILFFFTLGLNLFADRVVRRYRLEY